MANNNTNKKVKVELVIDYAAKRIKYMVRNTKPLMPVVYDGLAEACEMAGYSPSTK